MICKECCHVMFHRSDKGYFECKKCGNVVRSGEIKCF